MTGLWTASAAATATGGAAPLVAPEDYDNALQTVNFAGTAGGIVE